MRDADLSPREAEVLDALGERLTNAEIAGRLFLSTRTVESHVSSLLRKTGATNRRDLAAIALARSASASRGPRLRGLPASRTPFFGREDELSAVAAALTAGSIVTLTGPGGVGKTRLATEALGRTEAIRAVFVDLSAATDADGVIVAFAEALGVGDEPGRTWHDAMTARLADVTVLLVDNCEHVIEPAADIVAALVDRTTELMVLATSREPLAIAGERVIVVAPLPTPEGVEDLRALSASPSVQLFVDRAQAADSAFSLDEVSGGHIASVCRRLDGIPLALELAAAQVCALSPRQIDDRLTNRFALLRSTTRARPGRHAAMEATLAWSYDLLDVRERALLDRLAVFRGTFSVEAVQAVAVGAPVSSDNVTDLLVSLVRKSLVTAENAGEDKRYRLLETLREYAQQRLVGAGELALWREQHRQWMFARMQHAAEGLSCDVVPEWWHYLDDDLDNMEAALEWSLMTPEGAADALGVVRGLERYWMARGLRRSFGVRWSTLAAERATGVELAARVEGLLGATLLVMWSDLDAGRTLSERADGLSRTADDPAARGYAALGAAWIRMFEGDRDAAQQLADDAAALLERDDPVRPWAVVVSQTMSALPTLGEPERERLRDAAASFLEHQDRHLYGAWLSWSADLDIAAGDLSRARQSVEVAVAEARIAECPSCESQALASGALLQGSPSDQLAMAREALRLAHEVGEPWGALAAMEVVAGALVGTGAHADGVRLAAAVRAARTATGMCPVLPARYAALQEGEALAAASLNDTVARELQREGSQLDYGSTVALALG